MGGWTTRTNCPIKVREIEPWSLKKWFDQLSRHIKLESCLTRVYEISKVCFFLFKDENMFSGEKDSRWEPLATSLPTGDVGLEKNTGRDCNDNYLYQHHHLYHRHSSSKSIKGEQDLDFTDLTLSCHKLSKYALWWVKEWHMRSELPQHFLLFWSTDICLGS